MGKKTPTIQQSTSASEDHQSFYILSTGEHEY